MLCVTVAIELGPTVVGATAAAAAAAYRTGNTAGGRGAGGSPFFNILAIGCTAKLGLGGGTGGFTPVQVFSAKLGLCEERIEQQTFRN